MDGIEIFVHFIFFTMMASLIVFDFLPPHVFPVWQCASLGG